MNRLIPLEEVEKIWRLNHTPELMVVHPEWRYILLNNIYYIPTIDPIAIIDEMIDELLHDSSFWTGIINSHKIDTLQELKSRLTNIDSN